MKKQHKLYKSIIILSDIFVLLILIFRNYLINLLNYLNPKCFVLKLTGYPCPSCGGTRGFEAFCAGDFISAYNYNAFFFVLFIYLGILLFFSNLYLISKWNFAYIIMSGMSNYKVIICMAVCYLLFGIYRII